jgi:tripartite motif-containing protein 71
VVISYFNGLFFNDENKEMYHFINSWGSNGTGDGQFDSPNSIAINSSSGNVYIVEIGNDRIQKFDSNGTFIAEWGIPGTGDGEFNFPSGIAIDSTTGYVYVADTGNHRIQVFAPTSK